ncbi:MAG: CDP-alcohol phosphatidyltransferase family protein [Phycisphaeraceae bacterium]|nr:CDP-alcohol phosphatidyltransferase family protein [Phycisphaeraceae bacterium]
MQDQVAQAGKDRRPISSRERPFWKTMAGLLIRWRVSPNGISMASMLFGIGAGAALWATGCAEGWAVRVLFLGAAVLVQLRLICNMLDGMVAIGRGIASPTGELYNEVPDRVSDFFTLAGAGYALGGEMTIGYVAALLAVMTAYVRAIGKSLGARNDFCGPMAKPQRMFVVTAAAVMMAVLPDQFQWSWGPQGQWGLMAAALWVVAVGSAVTCLRRLRRIAGLLRNSSVGG